MTPDQPTSRNAPRNEWTERYGRDLTPLWLFGAGHVGRALVLALAPLPFRVSWLDPRENAFPPHIPANATPIRLRDPDAAVASAPGGAFILVMTHEHPLDLALTAAALARPDLPFVGLIGSGSKRARFEKRFREIGIPDERIDGLVCPIGVEGIADKDPAVIAAATAAQLLQKREALAPRDIIMTNEDDKHLAHAVALSREHMEGGRGGPFGAVIVREGRVLAEGWNEVTSSNDPTAHAEVVAIRRACREIGDFSLAGATLYASCEPCPMCLASAYWARVSRIVYANTRHEAAAIGFDDSFIYDEIPLDPAKRSLPAVHCPTAEAKAVFEDWLNKADKIRY